MADQGASMGGSNHHSQELDEAYQDAGTSEDGLSTDEAEQRLEEEGRNEIESGEEVHPLTIFLDQFRDFLVYLLIIAAIVSVGVGFFPGHDPEWADAALIIAIIVFNAILGFYQEYNAEKEIQALKDMSSPDATVLRDGQKRTIDSKDVVRGDIVFIQQGDAIPADCRLISVSSLETDESALTGESTQVSKETGVLDEDTPLAERTNMAYMNTTAVKGRGKAVVTETGMDTEVGDIAQQITEAEDKQTPFQEEVDRLGRKIGYIIMGIIAFVALFQVIFTDASLLSIFLVAIALAVAAVPEGLPIVVTLTLTLGSKKLLRKNALVRSLPVTESLGSVDVIVTDKTGTLTEDSMTVRRVLFDGEVYDVTGGAEGEGSFQQDGEDIDLAPLEPLLACGRICNNAEKTADGDYMGDPTEVAVLVSAKKAGVDPEMERVREIPFSSERKRMTVVTGEDEPVASMKGAPETVLERCDRILIDGEEKDLTEERREEVLERNEEFAEDALRVLGFARTYVEDPEAKEDDIESDMVFLGLQGMIDPPRSEVKQAVQDCRDAGISVVMATGDNIETAKAIGEQVGFDPEGAMTGNDVDELSEKELRECVEEVEVFARVSPSHKVQILKALQANGHRVAMTGDGVNDAPALKNADVGVSMGIRGTDVAEQSSDMILKDDNFVTIRDAVAEGRGIFDNIRKFVSYLLSYNAGEVLLLFIGTLIGTWLFPTVFQEATGQEIQAAGWGGEGGLKEAVVLTAPMLLWVNLVTDGLPAIALGADRKVPEIMDRPPRDNDEPVIDRRMMGMIVGVGSLMAVAILPLFFLNLFQARAAGMTQLAGMRQAQTMAFTALVVFEIVGIQAIRRVYNTPVFSNKWLWASIAGAMAIHLGVLYIPPISDLFNVVPLAPIDWMEILGSLAVFFVLVEILVALEDRIFQER